MIPNPTPRTIWPASHPAIRPTTIVISRLSLDICISASPGSLDRWTNLIRLQAFKMVLPRLTLRLGGEALATARHARPMPRKFCSKLLTRHAVCGSCRSARLGEISRFKPSFSARRTVVADEALFQNFFMKKLTQDQSRWSPPTEAIAQALPVGAPSSDRCSSRGLSGLGYGSYPVPLRQNRPRSFNGLFKRFKVSPLRSSRVRAKW